MIESNKQEEEEQLEEQLQQEMQEQKNPWWRELLSYVRLIVWSTIIAVIINRYVVINAEIPSESMENLLTVDDRIFGYLMSYVLQQPKRYDVVMFKYPVHEDTIYIKRVIGLPGETVEIKKGKIYIDGSTTPIEENYLPEKWVDGNDGYVFHVPEGCFLMLGDNRNISEDARYWAQRAIDAGVAKNRKEASAYTYVRGDKIIGRAIFKYYPKFDLFLNI